MPAIPATEVHEIPAVAAKTFPSLWVRDFVARSREFGDGELYFEVVPYNEETGEIDHEAPSEIRVPLWECINTVPEAAAAMQAVFAAIPAIQAWDDARKAAQAQEPGL